MFCERMERLYGKRNTVRERKRFVGERNISVGNTIPLRRNAKVLPVQKLHCRIALKYNFSFNLICFLLPCPLRGTIIITLPGSFLTGNTTWGVTGEGGSGTLNSVGIAFGLSFLPPAGDLAISSNWLSSKWSCHGNKALWQEYRYTVITRGYQKNDFIVFFCRI